MLCKRKAFECILIQGRNDLIMLLNYTVHYWDLNLLVAPSAAEIQVLIIINNISTF